MFQSAKMDFHCAGKELAQFIENVNVIIATYEDESMGETLQIDP